MLTKMVPAMEAQASGSYLQRNYQTRFSRLQIPLPSLETQQCHRI